MSITAKSFEDRLAVHLKVCEYPRGEVFRHYKLPSGEVAAFVVDNMGARIVVEYVDGPEVTKASVDTALRHARQLDTVHAVIYAPPKTNVLDDVVRYAKGLNVVIKRAEI